jgi:hypothetical protein
MLIILTVILSGANRRNTNIKILSPTHRRLCNLETGVLFSQEVEPKLISEFLHYLYVAEFPFILVCTVPMLSLISRVPWVPYCSVMSISVISQQFFQCEQGWLYRYRVCCWQVDPCYAAPQGPNEEKTKQVLKCKLVGRVVYIGDWFRLFKFINFIYR